ncbi:MAG TPA: PEFG-CTERM sorting domain-containing protein [Nitrosopumilaceae archaeon]|nr:PEFG-CTERM sorting domain-containing protein [Nitrosopumilaceae archaeon]
MTDKTVIVALVLVLVLGFATNSAFAHHVAKEIPVSTSPMKMSLAEGYLFVSNLGEREISVIDTATDQVVRKITTSEGVVAVKEVPDKNLVYAATFESGGIDIYNFETGEYVKTIALPDANMTVWYSPQYQMQKYITFATGGAALDYDSKNGILFVANFNADYVATIDTATNNILQKIPVSPHPYALKFDPITGKVLVANMAGNEVTFLSRNDEGIYRITNTVKTGTVPWGIDIDSDEHRAYVTHRGAHHITVLDIIDEKILTTIPVGDDTQAIAVDSSEHQVYVTYLQQHKIIKIDGMKDEIVNTIDSADLAWDIVVDSNTHKLYASMQGQDKVFVMGPNAIATTVPVVTMQIPIALVGSMMVHGQDVAVSAASVDIDNKAIVLATKTEDGGDLDVSIPRAILDSKEGEKDTTFLVYADNKLIEQQTLGGDDSTREISIQVPKNTETITITGTNVIPEFGPIAGLILVVSILSIVLITKGRPILH